MKKLLFLLLPAFLLAMSCTNDPKSTETTDATEEQKCCKDGEKQGCCKEMSEEQKANMAAWEDWANQTDEKKMELLNKRKECYEKMKAEKEAKEAEMAAKKAAFEEGMTNWDNLSLDEKKALFDNMPCCKKQGCHKGGEQKCCKGGEQKCCKEGEQKCHKDGEHKCAGGEGEHNCPNHKG